MEMKGDKDIMLGMDSKAKTDEETIHYPRKNQESDEIAETSSPSVFPLKKPRISPEMYKRCGERSGNGRGKRMMTYESQRAVSTQRKSMIAGKQRVSVIVEEGWEYDDDEYACPVHPSLNSPRILHRTPCLQAVLPVALQIDCENYGQISRYDKNRGCMECKTLTVKHPEILKKMQELGMEQESIDHFEKVTSSFSASRRVVELVRSREEMESVRRKEGYEEDAAETERETVRPQPSTVKAENLQLEEILEKNNTPPSSAESTELETPTLTSATVPAEQIPSDQVATLQSSSLLELETLNQLNQPQAAEIQLPETPPPFSPSRTPSLLSPERLTDNVHIQLDEDWDWDDEEPERVFGEVALAPSFTCQTGDEWIVVGSWKQ
ncbi:hypothetical protein ABEW05_011211 [Botrytis cinerea]